MVSKFGKAAQNTDKIGYGLNNRGSISNKENAGKIFSSLPRPQRFWGSPSGYRRSFLRC